MIDTAIKQLVCYGLEKGLFDKRDEVYVTNRVLEALKLDSIECSENYTDIDLETTLCEILDFAAKKGLIGDSPTERDLFDTKIMGLLLPPPSVITDRFLCLYNESPEKATDYY